MGISKDRSSEAVSYALRALPCGDGGSCELFAPPCPLPVVQGALDDFQGTSVPILFGTTNCTTTPLLASRITKIESVESKRRVFRLV